MRVPPSCVVPQPRPSTEGSGDVLRALRLFTEPGGDDRVSGCHDDWTDEYADEPDSQYAADHADEYNPQRNIGTATDQQRLEHVVETVIINPKHGREHCPAGFTLI